MLIHRFLYGYYPFEFILLAVCTEAIRFKFRFRVLSFNFNKYCNLLNKLGFQRLFLRQKVLKGQNLVIKLEMLYYDKLIL